MSWEQNGTDFFIRAAGRRFRFATEQSPFGSPPAAKMAERRTPPRTRSSVGKCHDGRSDRLPSARCGPLRARGRPYTRRPQHRSSGSTETRPRRTRRGDGRTYRSDAGIEAATCVHSDLAPRPDVLNRVRVPARFPRPALPRSSASPLVMPRRRRSGPSSRLGSIAPSGRRVRPAGHRPVRIVAGRPTRTGFEYIWTGAGPNDAGEDFETALDSDDDC